MKTKTELTEKEKEEEKEEQKRYPYELLVFKGFWDAGSFPQLIFHISEEELQQLKEGGEAREHHERMIGKDLGAGHYVLGIQDNIGIVGNKPCNLHCKEIGTVELEVVIKSVKGTWTIKEKK